MMSVVICVTGMHRSGTSLVMSWLERCGLRISGGQLVPSGGGNEKGHFEDAELVELHLKSIASQVPGSKGWILTNEKQMRGLQLNKEIQSTIVQKRNQTYSVWGWKDPRTVFFLDAWKEQIPDLNVLGIWRPCREVVDSLLKRARKRNDGVVKISPWCAVQLWKLSNRLLLDHYNQHPDTTLIYGLADVVRNDDQVLGRIKRQFQANLKYHPISTVFDSTMLHSDGPSLISALLHFDCEVRQLTNELKVTSLLSKR